MGNSLSVHSALRGQSVRAKTAQFAIELQILSQQFADRFAQQVVTQA